MSQWTLQRLFLEYPPNKLGLRLPLYQLKAVDAISTCRTAKMGSHGQYCEHGHLCGVYSSRVHCEGQEELENWPRSPQHVQSMGSVFVVCLSVQGKLTPTAPDRWMILRRG